VGLSQPGEMGLKTHVSLRLSTRKVLPLDAISSISWSGEDHGAVVRRAAVLHFGLGLICIEVDQLAYTVGVSSQLGEEGAGFGFIGQQSGRNRPKALADDKEDIEVWVDLVSRCGVDPDPDNLLLPANGTPTTPPPDDRAAAPLVSARSARRPSNELVACFKRAPGRVFLGRT